MCSWMRIQYDTKRFGCISKTIYGNCTLRQHISFAPLFRILDWMRFDAMFIELTILYERFRAIFANVWPFSGVSGHVILLQCCKMCEICLCQICTWIFTRYFVKLAICLSHTVHFSLAGNGRCVDFICRYIPVRPRRCSPHSGHVFISPCTVSRWHFNFVTHLLHIGHCCVWSRRGMFRCSSMWSPYALALRNDFAQMWHSFGGVACDVHMWLFRASLLLILQGKVCRVWFVRWRQASKDRWRVLLTFSRKYHKRTL